jgi:hypothetical protein
MARRVLVERCRHQNMTAPAAVRGEYEQGWRVTSCDWHRLRVASGAHRCRAVFRSS